MKLSEDPSKLSEVLQAAAGFRDAFDKEKEAEEKLSAYVSFGRGGLGSGREILQMHALGSAGESGIISISFRHGRGGMRRRRKQRSPGSGRSRMQS